MRSKGRATRSLHHRALAVGLGLLLACVLASAAAAVPVCRATPVVGAAPTSAGLAALTPDQLLSGFSNQVDAPAPVQTRAGVYLDRANLYLVVECLEPRMSALAAKCQKDDDGAVFQDDCVELFLSRTGAATGYLHLATNANGARFTQRGHGEAQLNLPWTVKPTRGADRWTLELTFPLSALDGQPTRGDVWWINLCRQRQAGGELQLSAWSPTDSNFHDTTRFGALVFDDAYGSYLRTAFLTPWETRKDALQARINGQPTLSRQLAQALAPGEAALQPLHEAVASSRAVPLPALGELLDAGRTALRQLAQAEANLDEAVVRRERQRALAALAEPDQDLLVWSTRAVTDDRVLPTPDPPASLSADLSLRACRGEYEPASFVVYPVRRTTTLTVEVSDLAGPAGTIPAAAVDVRAVKCWYQAGGNERFPTNRGMHLMTPELLLRDDDLIRVDTSRQRNYVKLQYSDGRRKWLDLTNPEPSPEEQDSSVAALPICDAVALQPVTVRARTAKQFWVTVHVPDDARAGKYRSQVTLRAGGQALKTVPLMVEVLPFDLAENPLESSIYFHWGLELDMDGPGTLGIRERSPAQFKAELRNLLAHGVDNPTVGVFPASGQLPEELKLRQEVGMRSDRLYYLVASTSGLATEDIKQIAQIAKGFGFSEIYFYAADEASGDRLTAQRADFEKVHAAGGKVFVAGSVGQNFPLVGDLQDLLVCYGDPDKEEAARWHGKGHKIFCYANPQGGIEAPEMNRRNFGLLLAVNDYDGGMTYIYYSGIPSWGDWCIPPYRQHNYVYPTVDGVIDTVQWEGYREGIDDLRYLGTLREAITGAGKTKAAAQAQSFLDNLDVTGDLYAVRAEMIRWIMRLQP